MTPKEAAFVHEYLVDLNASASVYRAGYKAKNDNSAKRIGFDLLRRPHIVAAVQAAMDKRAARTDITADRVLTEIGRMAFYDPADFATETVEVRSPADIKKLPEDVRRAIVGWSWDKAGNFTIKLADKLAANGLLGRHLKLFTDKVEHTGKDGTALGPAVIVSDDLVREALARRLREV